MEREYPTEYSTAEKNEHQGLQSDEIIFRLWSPLISQERQENQKRTTDFKWSFLDLRECHGRVNATFKCCFCL